MALSWAHMPSFQQAEEIASSLSRRRVGHLGAHQDEALVSEPGKSGLIRIAIHPINQLSVEYRKVIGKVLRHCFALGRVYGKHMEKNRQTAQYISSASFRSSIFSISLWEKPPTPSFS